MSDEEYYGATWEWLAYGLEKRNFATECLPESTELVDTIARRLLESARAERNRIKFPVPIGSELGSRDLMRDYALRVLTLPHGELVKDSSLSFKYSWFDEATIRVAEALVVRFNGYPEELEVDARAVRSILATFRDMDRDVTKGFRIQFAAYVMERAAALEKELLWKIIDPEVVVNAFDVYRMVCPADGRLTRDVNNV